MLYLVYCLCGQGTNMPKSPPLSFLNFEGGGSNSGNTDTHRITEQARNYNEDGTFYTTDNTKFIGKRVYDIPKLTNKFLSMAFLQP
jgi:hypothetical protein